MNKNSTIPYKKNDIKKVRAIELWRETRGHVSNISKALDIDRGTFYNWLKNDKEFAIKIIESEEELNDDVRDALIQKIADGNLGAIIFYLRKKHPEFKDNPLNIANQFKFTSPFWFNPLTDMKLELIEDGNFK